MAIAENRTEDVWAESIRTARARFKTVEPERLAAHIAAQSDVFSPVVISGFRTLADGSGMSNGITFFTAQVDRGGGIKAHDLVLRYSPGVSLIKQKNFSDEYLTTRAAFDAGLPAPKAFWPDATGDSLGCEGFVMERVDADAPASSIYTEGPVADASPTVRREMLLQAAGLQGQLRRAAIGPDRVPHLLKRGSGPSDIQRELNWWLREAELNTHQDDPKLQLVRDVHAWMSAHVPKVRPATLAHGDGQICNIMFRENLAKCWLDWELAYLGHQETDLMMILMNTDLLKPSGVTIEGIPTENEFVLRFERESGAAVEGWEYFKLFMVYKYLVGLLFAAQLMPNIDEMWVAIQNYLDATWPDAKAAAKFG